MYFIIEYLSTLRSLTSHQYWILFLMLAFALVLSAAALVIKSQEGSWDAMLVVQSLLIWGLVFDRILVSLWYQFLLYEEYQGYYPAWVLLRHLSLLCIELPLYCVGFLLMGPRLKRGIKKVIGGWLEDA